MSIKQLLRSLLFLLIAAVMLFSLTDLLRDHESTLRSYYSEPQNTVGVIFVGGSHVNSSFIPAMLWREHGISAHNVFSWNQPMWTSYSYIKEALRTQSPAVVVLDLFGMTYGHSYIPAESMDSDNYQNSFNLRMGTVQYEMMWNSWQNSNQTPPLSEYLNLFRYHGRWEHLSAGDFSFNYENYHDVFKGYSIQTSVQPITSPGWRTPQYQREPDQRCITFLDKIVALSQKEGFDLIFTMTPYDFNEAERQIFLWLDQYATSREIPFFNYNLSDGERIGFDYATDLVDKGHTNYSGAAKITRDIGEYLSRNEDIPVYTEIGNWEQRDADTFEFGRVEQANVMLLQDDVMQYLHDAVKDPWYATFIVIRDAADLSLEMRDLLAISSTAHGSTVRVFSGGKITSTRDTVALHGEYTVEILTASGFSLRVGTTEYAGSETSLGILIVDKLFEQPVDFASVTQSAPESLLHFEFTAAERNRVKN